MQQRTLGTQGLAVSAIGYGSMGMTHGLRRPGDEQEAIATIRAAYELGVTFFDTAELYGIGTGTNEQLVGKAFKRLPRPRRSSPPSSASTCAPIRFRQLYSRPEHIREVADNSLRYLGVDAHRRPLPAPRRPRRADRGRRRRR